jgi:hypothetical protein
MGWFAKQDPLAAKEKALDRQIARLEKQIAELSSSPLPEVQPRSRAASRGPATPQASAAVPLSDDRPIETANGGPTPRQFDLAGLWQRWFRRFSGGNASDTRLVTMLAAGSVHGLRPLRYEKRIARRRFLALLAILLLILYGVARVLFRNAG